MRSGEVPDPNPRDVWIEQTLRLNERYLVEVVERFGLCPWAKSTRIDGQLVRRVSLQIDTDPEPTLTALREWADEPAIEIGLLLLPRLSLGRSEFQRFVNDVIALDSQRQGTRSPAFALAAFHPAAELDLGNADRLVPFLRRSPDPTIQVVRIAALERVRRDEVAGTQYIDLRSFRIEQLPTPAKTLRDRIGEHNLRTACVGAQELSDALSAIMADHRSTRATLPAFAEDQR
jgi:hypothetical protein